MVSVHHMFENFRRLHRLVVTPKISFKTSNLFLMIVHHIILNYLFEKVNTMAPNPKYLINDLSITRDCKYALQHASVIDRL